MNLLRRSALFLFLSAGTLALGWSLLGPAQAAPTQQKRQVLAPLMVAVRSGDLRTARRLAKNSASLNARGTNGDTPISHAVKCRNYAVAQTLLNAGANPNRVNDEGRTPLYFAVEAGDTALVELLLKHGARVGIQYEIFETSMEVAARCGRVEALAAMWRHGVSFKNEIAERTLVEAVRMNQPKVVRFMIQHGTKVNTGDMAEASPLEVAVGRGHMETIKTLLELGADPNFPPDSTEPALALACSRTVDDPMTLVKLLLAKGAKVNGWGRRDQASPIGIAAASGELEILQLLLSKGANPNGLANGILYELGPEPIPAIRAVLKIGNLYSAEQHIATYGGTMTLAERAQTRQNAEARDLPIVGALLNRGVRLNQGENRFALIDAAQTGRLSCVELLIKHGAPVNLRDSEVFSRAELPIPDEQTSATAGGVRDTIFDTWGGAFGNTPFRAACSYGHVEIAQFLLGQGAKADVIDINGQTALMALASWGASSNARTLPLGWELGRFEEDDVIPNPQVTAQEIAENVRIASVKDLGLIKLLLKAGVPVNAQDKAGDSALSMAAVQGNLEVVNALLAEGANPNAQDIDGESVLIRVMKMGERATAPILPPPQQRDGTKLGDKKRFKQYRETVIRRCISMDTDCIRALVKAGADPGLKDKKGRTAFDVAKALKYPEAAAVLEGKA